MKDKVASINQKNFVISKKRIPNLHEYISCSKTGAAEAPENSERR